MQFMEVVYNIYTAFKCLKKNNLMPRGGKQPGAGRPKGSTSELAQMVRASLSRVGGIEYLVEQSKENPTAYMGLLKQLMPKQVDSTMSIEGDLFKSVELRVVDGSSGES